MTEPLHNLTVEDFLNRLDTLADDRLFSEHHAAAMIGKAVKTLQEERRLYNRARERDAAEAEQLKGKIAPWIAVGAGGIRYRLGDLREWISQQRFGGAMLAPTDSLTVATAGVGIMIARLANGLLPFAVVDGRLIDFLDSADDDVDSVEMMRPEQAFFLGAMDLRLAPSA